MPLGFGTRAPRHGRLAKKKQELSRKMIESMGMWGSRLESENAKSASRAEDYALGGHVLDPEVPNEKREPAAFTSDVMHVANILTLKDDTRPVGGFKFRVFRYWGDIDFMERVHSGPTLDDACKYIAARLQLMGQRIRLSSLIEPGRIYFSELKAGLDTAYTIHGLGHYEYDAVSNEDRLVQYRPDELRECITKLCDDGWLSADEAAELLAHVHPDSGCTFKEHDALRRAARRHYVLRWTLDELLAGVKELPRNRKITLTEALKIPTLTKCDVWALVDGRYIEVSNNFFLTYSSEDCIGSTLVNSGAEPVPSHVSLISEPLADYVSAVHLDINHFIETSHSMKASKRMWVLAQWEYSLVHDPDADGEISHEEEVLVERMNTLAPLFSSRAAALNQVATDCKTLVELLERYPETPMGPVLLHILRLWKQTLNNLPYSKYDEVLALQAPVYDVIRNDVTATRPAKEVRDVITTALSKLEPVLEKDVEEFVRSFLVSRTLLPSFRSYEDKRVPLVRNTDLIDPSPLAKPDDHFSQLASRMNSVNVAEKTTALEQRVERTVSVSQRSPRRRALEVGEHGSVNGNEMETQEQERLQPGQHGTVPPTPAAHPAAFVIPGDVSATSGAVASDAAPASNAAASGAAASNAAKPAPADAPDAKHDDASDDDAVPAITVEQDVFDVPQVEVPVRAQTERASPVAVTPEDPVVAGTPGGGAADGLMISLV
eukprot:m.102665 g.102665  ORF g.102665 m.102665 type:complete len:719 (+) comp8830_c0_seq2:8-2164(+)